MSFTERHTNQQDIQATVHYVTVRLGDLRQDPGPRLLCACGGLGDYFRSQLLLDLCRCVLVYVLLLRPFMRKRGAFNSEMQSLC